MPVQLQWAVAQKNANGEDVCGDAYVALENDDRVLLAVIDGAGHGPNAHRVAQDAANYIQENGAGTALDTLLRQLHETMRGGRGVAVSLVEFHLSTSKLQFAGVGNVEMRSTGPDELHPVPSTGIIGRTLRKVQVFDYTVAHMTYSVIFTDGISSRVSVKDYKHLPVQQAAEAILNDHHRNHDDGTCIVFKYGIDQHERVI